MRILTDDMSKRGALATLASVTLHGTVIVGLCYVSVNQTQKLPSAQQAIQVELLAPEVQPEPATKSHIQPAPQPVHTEKTQPETESSPAQASPGPDPVAVEKPKPIPVVKPTPKPEPAHRKENRVKKKGMPSRPVLPEESARQVSDQTNPFAKETPAQQSQVRTAPQTSTQNNQSVTEGKPQRLTMVNPAYPSRALALHVEGQVRVKFDVDAQGQVTNIQILSARPQVMFDREVKMALKRWRYTPGKPASDQTITIFFRIGGGTSIE